MRGQKGRQALLTVCCSLDRVFLYRASSPPRRCPGSEERRTSRRRSAPSVLLSIIDPPSSHVRFRCVVCYAQQTKDLGEGKQYMRARYRENKRSRLRKKHVSGGVVGRRSLVRDRKPKKTQEETMAGYAVHP